MADIPLSDLSLFSKGRSLPGTMLQFLILLAASLLFGIISTILLHIGELPHLVNIAVAGATTGIIGLTIPAMLAVLTIKMLKRKVRTKYIMLMALVATAAYSIFMVLGSALFAVTHSYGLLLLLLFLGDAGTFIWWFFMSKVVLNQRFKAGPLSLIHPTLNALFLVPASLFFLSASIPIRFVFVRLYAGIFIFALVSYIVAYLIDSPIKRSLGISGIDVFSQVMQNWLFQANISMSSSKRVEVDVNTDTLAFKRADGSIKSILFVPEIHYGLVGTIGSSNFPFLLERHSTQKYGSQTLVMHSTVSEEYNAFSSDQYKYICSAMDSGVAGAQRLHGGISYYTSSHNNCKVILLKFSSHGIAILTRAPKVTEDISHDAGEIIRKEFEKIVDNVIIIDAHNSRYETAQMEELSGINTKSKELQDYIRAIKGLRKPLHKSGKVQIGASNIDIYSRLQAPIDMAKGALNALVFQFNGFKFCLIQFNANNISPRLRTSIINHIRAKYDIFSEICTTDTHFVNSLANTESNALGKHTKYKALEPLVDEAVKTALDNIEEVQPFHKSVVVKRFRIWGLDRDSIVTVMHSMLSITRLLVPITIIVGFFIAALVIAVV